ncbi:MFS general substrate transporter [Macrolepiota fuliginosa MF-IS2]|uniref:MFS general substrate transporter n=1 Tax=Macrolepiota fuliginosa MF-IS2 TaxID=1400762 RepID=A0A9P5XDD3_9AGAR|nr:MFS general substrate transporter [Macrolepiota fuliginosa MF-IS2]
MMEPTKDTSSVVSQAREDSSIEPGHAPKHRIVTAAEERAVRKLDYTIVPIMTMFYLLSFLDRANIGNARVAGLQKGLGLTDHQYQVCVTVLYVPYIVAELPSNLLLRWVGPRLLMPTILTAWGIVVTLQGLVSSYAGLVVVRAVLGLVEGPMFPGIVLYLSGFYTRRDLSLRIALFFSSASLSGAFSGLLAAAIQNMNGIGGRPGWAWIFILEGLFSVIIGLISFFIVPSTPADCKFLTPTEKELIQTRLEHDRPSVTPGVASDKFSFREILRSLTSIHVIILFIVLFLVGTTLYGLALFLPSIVNQLGFSPVRSQLLSVGPFAAGFFVTLISAYLSDKYQNRAIPSAVISTLAVAGFALYLRSTNKFVAYGSLFLTVPGVYAVPPLVSAWMSNNSEPYFRRATSIALGFVATNAGGILSTWRFPTKEGPRFTKTTIMDLTFSVLAIVFVFINVAVLHFKNQRKRKLRTELLAPYADEKESDGGLKAWMELGDKHPDFVYCY